MVSMMFWQPFVSERSVVSLDVGILLWLSGLGVLDGYALFLDPYQQLVTDTCRSLSTFMVLGLACHSIIRSRLRMTRSTGIEKLSSMLGPFRLKPSSAFNSRTVRQSPRQFVMKSMEQGWVPRALPAHRACPG